MPETSYLSPAGKTIATVRPSRLDNFKFEIIDDFIRQYNIESAVELKGEDIFPLETRGAEQMLMKSFQPDSPSLWTVNTVDKPTYSTPIAKLSISLESPDNILEEDTAHSQLVRLFKIASNFVIINTELKFIKTGQSDRPAIVKLADWAKEFRPDWFLAGFYPARFPRCPVDNAPTSSADFFFFSQKEELDYKYRIWRKKESPEQVVDSKVVADLMDKARVGMEANDPQKSAENLEKALSMDPDNLTAANNLGLILFILGQTREAESVFKSILSRNNSAQSARMILAKIYLREKRWADLRCFLPEILLLRRMDSKIEAVWPEIREEFLNLDRAKPKMEKITIN